MNISTRQSSIRTIKQGHPLFTISDGLITAQRAGFEINQKCPSEYRQIIMTCIDLGWLTPVACITTEEQFIETLKL